MSTSNFHISALADPDLAQIFKNLPPFDRLRVSEVCKRWWCVSQDPWRDVTHLELTSIPDVSIGAIVRMCPNLTSLFCKGQELILDDLRDITLASFKSLELHDCIYYSHDDAANKTGLPLFRSEYGQSMEELILHAHDFGLEPHLSKRYSQRLLPVSLKRLQLSGLRSVGYHGQRSYLTELRKLRALESLILHSTDADHYSASFKRCVLAAVRPLKNLRELLLSTLTGLRVDAHILAETALKLTRLEILILPEDICDSELLRQLFFEHPTLRILVIPGHPVSRKPFVLVPVRGRFLNGVAGNPLPFLHIFVGESAAKLFRFADSPTNWLRVHRIDATFPELLEREEIAEIFGNSWIAKQIKEGAKRGIINFSKYEGAPVDDNDDD